MVIVNSVDDPSGAPPPVRRRRGCLFYVRRGLVALILLILVLSVLGFVYEAAAEASDRQAYLPPGQLFDVDGHQMHIVCTGEGSPTVILEAAGGHFSTSWSWVQAEVEQTTRVCAYDRAGYGWSDPGPEPRDAQRIVSELHVLLGLAGVEPPYVMVGHSVGGLYVRVFDAQYPGEVAGMVLVDATHPDTWERQGESVATMQMMAGASAALARVGLLRLFFGGQDLGLPAGQNAAVIADMSSGQYWDTQRADLAAADATVDEGNAAGDLGDMPLAVLVALTYPEGPGRDTERALQVELAALSTNSSYQEIDGAGHVTLVTDAQYARFVGEAILNVIEAAQTGEPLAE
ncbi:MAG: alpha/beta hydrolase [Anaerolineae bacterium]|nr:alpha/beta hydrolase [Anaerolineae bacterium]